MSTGGRDYVAGRNWAKNSGCNWFWCSNWINQNQHIYLIKWWNMISWCLYPPSLPLYHPLYFLVSALSTSCSIPLYFSCRTAANLNRALLLSVADDINRLDEIMNAATIFGRAPPARWLIASLFGILRQTTPVSLLYTGLHAKYSADATELQYVQHLPLSFSLPLSLLIYPQ